MTDKKHAKFNASASYRWLACPGSIALSETVPTPPDTAAALEGTKGHLCLETFLKNGHGKMLGTGLFLKGQGFDVQMILHAETAARHIWELQSKARGSEVLCETKSKLFHIHREAHGTTDAAVLQHFGRLYVIDYKYGKMPVEADQNTQMIFYALGIAHEYNYNFEDAELIIIQPRAAHEKGAIRSWVISMEELRGWNRKFKDGVEAALKPKAKLKSGGHCFFCPAKPACKEYTPDVAKSMRSFFIKPKTEAEQKAQIALDFKRIPSGYGKTTKQKSLRKKAW